MTKYFTSFTVSVYKQYSLSIISPKRMVLCLGQSTTIHKQISFYTSLDKKRRKKSERNREEQNKQTTTKKAQK